MVIIEQPREKMVVTVPAVYEKGTLRLLKPIDLPEQAEVQVTIEAVTKSKPHYPTCSRSLAQLKAITDAIALGGDALEESEALYDADWE